LQQFQGNEEGFLDFAGRHSLRECKKKSACYARNDGRGKAPENGRGKPRPYKLLNLAEIGRSNAAPLQGMAT